METILECFIESLGQQKGVTYFKYHKKVLGNLLNKLRNLLTRNDVNTESISVFLENVSSSYEQKIISKIQQSSVRNLEVLYIALDEAWKESIQENESKMLANMLVSKFSSMV